MTDPSISVKLSLIAERWPIDLSMLNCFCTFILPRLLAPDMPSFLCACCLWFRLASCGFIFLCACCLWFRLARCWFNFLCPCCLCFRLARCGFIKMSIISKVFKVPKMSKMSTVYKVSKESKVSKISKVFKVSKKSKVYCCWLRSDDRSTDQS